jgi:hypothetical protein
MEYIQRAFAVHNTMLVLKLGISNGGSGSKGMYKAVQSLIIANLTVRFELMAIR